MVVAFVVFDELDGVVDAVDDVVVVVAASVVIHAFVDVVLYAK